MVLLAKLAETSRLMSLSAESTLEVRAPPYLYTSFAGYKDLHEMAKEKKLLGAVQECWMQYDNHPFAKFDD